jgi:hypothetical protein
MLSEKDLPSLTYFPNSYFSVKTNYNDKIMSIKKFFQIITMFYDYSYNIFIHISKFLDHQLNHFLCKNENFLVMYSVLKKDYNIEMHIENNNILRTRTLKGNKYFCYFTHYYSCRLSYLPWQLHILPLPLVRRELIITCLLTPKNPAQRKFQYSYPEQQTIEVIESNHSGKDVKFYISEEFENNVYEEFGDDEYDTIYDKFYSKKQRRVNNKNKKYIEFESKIIKKQKKRAIARDINFARDKKNELGKCSEEEEDDETDEDSEYTCYRSCSCRSRNCCSCRHRRHRIYSYSYRYDYFCLIFI